jgi:hypothetical protein
VAAVLAVVPWLIGVAVTAPFETFTVYLSSWAFYLGVVGVTFVLWAMTRGIEKLCHNLSGLEDVAVDKDAFLAEVHQTLSRGARRKSTGIVIGTVLATELVVIVLAVHGWSDMHKPAKPGPIQFFPREWRDNDGPLVAGIVSGVFALWVAAALGTAMELLLRNMLFIRRLSRLDYVAFPAIVRARLHPFIYTYLFASVTWSAGIGLFAIFFVGGYSIPKIALLGVFVVIGIATFGVPYAAMRAVLDRCHEKMSYQLARRVVQVSWQPDFAKVDIRDFTTVNTIIAADAPPVLSRRGALAYVVFQLVVVTGLVEKAFIQGVLQIGS